MTFIAAFAYLLAPDNSHNANQMHLSIHSRPPGFSTQILILPNSNFQQGTEEIAIEKLVWKKDKLSLISLEYFNPFFVKELSQFLSN